MAKAPRPGTVKTRLRPLLSESQCAELAECLLRDTTAKAIGLSENVSIAFSPADGEAEIAARLHGKLRYVEQKGSDLGERLTTVVDDAHSNGSVPIIIIGTDSPTLPATYIENAILHLKQHDNGVVVGATDDGGYYLIGLSRPEPAVFSDVEWSSERVYEQTIANVHKIDAVDLFELPRWYDVDTPDDLRRLLIEIEGDPKARSAAPETSRWLVGNRKVFNM